MTHEELENELMRVEADLVDLGQITHRTVHNLDRLTGIVSTLADGHQSLALKLEALTGTVDRLAERIDRFIAGQSNGRHN
jgi:hypothetical protein